ncbi:hypothetical protein ACFOG5_24735 [Pedobacter fastidiosus]|uniref:hypothetical protein n=1 Tax=Pedobacter fastidiosus TaxID=2765361 RepID=UPI00360ECAFF
MWNETGKGSSKAVPAKHDDIKMPMKEDAKKAENMEDMSGMQMGDNNATMENIKKAKSKFRPYKNHYQ